MISKSQWIAASPSLFRAAVCRRSCGRPLRAHRSAPSPPVIRRRERVEGRIRRILETRRVIAGTSRSRPEANCALEQSTGWRNATAVGHDERRDQRGKRDSNPRLRPWQGRTLPLSYSRSLRTSYCSRWVEPDSSNCAPPGGLKTSTTERRLTAQHPRRFLRRHRVPEHPAAPFQPAEPRRRAG